MNINFFIMNLFILVLNLLRDSYKVNTKMLNFKRKSMHMIFKIGLNK